MDLPPPTRYDQAGRYLLLAAGARLFAWLFAGTQFQLRFERWLPTPLPGDRYQLLAVVVNLTGKGDAAHQCVLDAAEWTLRPREVDLGQLDAAEVLAQIEADAAPRERISCSRANSS